MPGIKDLEWTKTSESGLFSVVREHSAVLLSLPFLVTSLVVPPLQPDVTLATSFKALSPNTISWRLKLQRVGEEVPGRVTSSFKPQVGKAHKQVEGDQKRD